MSTRDDWASEWQDRRPDPPHSSQMTQALLWLLRPVGYGVAIVLAIVIVVNNLP